ncbi:MAG: flagellar hook-length control protein FliK [Firmicutes bacterium]|nr:flagellar hook-length control protein FliK [Bacillota bacterium]
MLPIRALPVTPKGAAQDTHGPATASRKDSHFEQHLGVVLGKITGVQTPTRPARAGSRTDVKSAQAVTPHDDKKKASATSALWLGASIATPVPQDIAARINEVAPLAVRKALGMSQTAVEHSAEAVKVPGPMAKSHLTVPPARPPSTAVANQLIVAAQTLAARGKKVDTAATQSKPRPELVMGPALSVSRGVRRSPLPAALAKGHAQKQPVDLSTLRSAPLRARALTVSQAELRPSASSEVGPITGQNGSSDVFARLIEAKSAATPLKQTPLIVKAAHTETRVQATTGRSDASSVLRAVSVSVPKEAKGVPAQTGQRLSRVLTASGQVDRPNTAHAFAVSRRVSRLRGSGKTNAIGVGNHTGVTTGAIDQVAATIVQPVARGMERKISSHRAEPAPVPGQTSAPGREPNSSQAQTAAWVSTVATTGGGATSLKTAAESNQQLTVPMDQFMPTVAQWTALRAKYAKSNGPSVVSITLVPEHLGTVHVTLSAGTSGHLHVSLLSTLPQTSSAIQADLSQLRDRLTKNGYADVQIDVFTQGQGQGQEQGVSEQRAYIPPLQTLSQSDVASTAERSPSQVLWMEQRETGTFYAQA